eukprot:10286241-Alexandrium_andersonii.AAC.1
MPVARVGKDRQADKQAKIHIRTRKLPNEVPNGMVLHFARRRHPQQSTDPSVAVSRAPVRRSPH